MGFLGRLHKLLELSFPVGKSSFWGLNEFGTGNRGSSVWEKHYNQAEFHYCRTLMRRSKGWDGNNSKASLPWSRHWRMSYDKSPAEYSHSTISELGHNWCAQNPISGDLKRWAQKPCFIWDYLSKSPWNFSFLFLFFSLPSFPFFSYPSSHLSSLHLPWINLRTTRTRNSHL